MKFQLVYFLLFLLSYNLISCSLDFPVEDEITGLDAIDNTAIAEETLAGIYVAFPKNKINFSKLADDFYPNHTISDNTSDYQFYNWNQREIQYFSNSLWSNYYTTISKANILLNRIPKIKSNTSKEHKKLQEIKAQTLCLKALCYFDLILMYSETYNENTKNNPGILLKNDIKQEKLPRSTLEKSYQETEKLLLDAISIFSETETTSYRFSKNGAKALLAKVYFNWKKYNKAIKLCDEVIPTKIIDDNSFTEMWEDLESTSGRNSKIISETFLALETSTSYFSDIYDNADNTDEYYLNPLITYENGDTRKATAIITNTFRNLDNSTQKVNYLGKFRSEITDVEAKSIPIIRVAELYFIKAEALYHLSQGTEAKQVINNFLTLRNTTLITTQGTTFLSDLLNEKQKEFVGEGIRYFDMKRNKIVIHKVNFRNNQFTFSIENKDYRWLLPIAENELKYNENIVNNTGY